jgi:hypothetical protein
MMAGMVEETTEQKLRRHEDALALCMAEITALRNENAALKANASAHQTLAEIYRNPAELTTNRIRAASAALGHESAPLKPTEAPLDLVGEEIVEPLAVVVERQRARANKMLLEPPFSDLPKHFPLRSDGNGDDTGS